MRFMIIDISVKSKSIDFVWSSHHLLGDGWSMPLIMKEVLPLYTVLSEANIYLNLKPITYPFKNYIAWLQKQDLSEAETFWKQVLKGFTTPTLLSKQSSNSSNNNSNNIGMDNKSYDTEKQLIELDSSLKTSLKSLIKQNQLTVNTMLQGIWSLVLSIYTNQLDVLFGGTTSGRNADVIGIETMIGIFINTIPVRIVVDPENSMIDWLKKIQWEQIEARQYEFTPLVQIQGWSDVPKGMTLFDSLLVFENYPVDKTTISTTTTTSKTNNNNNNNHDLKQNIQL